MGLAGKIGGLADNVVASRLHRCDGCRVLQTDTFKALTFCNLCLIVHDISHCYRIGRIASFKTDLTSEHSRKQVPLR